MEDLLPIIVSGLMGLGGGGGLVALLKVKPESGRIVVDAAQGAVVVQDTVLKRLEAENARLHADGDQLRERVAALERQLTALRAEVREDRA